MTTRETAACSISSALKVSRRCHMPVGFVVQIAVRLKIDRVAHNPHAYVSDQYIRPSIVTDRSTTIAPPAERYRIATEAVHFWVDKEH
jgi:hypothetical protein